MKRKPEEELRVAHWFSGQSASQLARRHEVWTLLGWYHQRVVEPQLGVAGALRRLWWRLSGQTWRLSPWRDVSERIARAKAARAVLEGHRRVVEKEKVAAEAGR